MPLYFDFQPRGGNFYLKNLIIHYWSPDMKQVCLLLALLLLLLFFWSLWDTCWRQLTIKLKKNLRSWDSEGLKLDCFWIFTEISKYEQLYLLFTSIRISVFMLVWKSPRCSLRKYIVLCTHITVIKCSQKSRKAQKLLFFHFIPFSASPYCTKAPTDMSWKWLFT